ELTGRDAGSVTSGRAAWWGFFFPGGGSIRPPGFCGGAATGGRAVDLFERAALDAGEKDQPLAARMRPRRLEDMVGQEAVLGPRSALRRAIEQGRIPSLILYGPPGSGKDRKSTRLNSSHVKISYAVSCLKKKRPSTLRC